ncbi:MAG: hypothetical protein ACOH18_00110 [Candidatus Saccharimonadaceae bacterium]
MKQLFSKENRSDLIVAAVILACLLLSSNVFSGFMPSAIVMFFIALFVAAFTLFAVLIWRENPRDEREAQILLSSDRLGFLIGAIILSVVLVYESLNHQSTTLIALALSGMVLGKIIGKYIQK